MTEKGYAGLSGPNYFGQPQCHQPMDLISAQVWVIRPNLSWLFLNDCSDFLERPWTQLTILFLPGDARLSMGPVAATTPLGCCGTALLGLWQPLAPGLHDPWRVTPFFISPLLNTHHPNPLSTRCPSSSHNAGAIVVTSKVNVGQVLKQFGRGFNISLAVQATDLRSTPGNQLDWPKSELFTASNHQNPGYGEV